MQHHVAERAAGFPITRFRVVSRMIPKRWEVDDLKETINYFPAPSHGKNASMHWFKQICRRTLILGARST